MIIGLGHQRGAGKTTAANFLQDQYGGRVIHIADKIKAVSYAMFAQYGLKPGHYYEDNRKEKEINLPKINLSPRDIYTKVGIFGRDIYPFFWIDQAIKQNGKQNIYIPDVRYFEEIRAIKKASGFVVKIDNPNQSPVKDPLDPDNVLTPFKDWDIVIYNDGDKKQLKYNILASYQFLKKTHNNR